LSVGRARIKRKKFDLLSRYAEAKERNPRPHFHNIRREQSSLVKRKRGAGPLSLDAGPGVERTSAV